MIDGSQNAVWRLALKGEIPQNYENRSKENNGFEPCLETLGHTAKVNIGT